MGGGEPRLDGHPTQLVFGRGAVDQLPAHVLGSALVLTTAGATRRGVTRRMLDMLRTALVDDGVRPNPTTESVERLIARHRDKPVETIVAVGGGSVIDSAKVLSVALATGSATLARLLERPDDVSAIEPVRVVAVPTTAGTGAEVTPTATLWDAATRRKLSVGTRRMFPAVAIVDPDLTDALPWDETLSTGLDALSQCYESICSRTSTGETAWLAERGLALIPGALRALRADDHGDDPRSAMAEGALLSGLAISRTRTGLAHSMSYPVTARLDVPHGLACALFLPGVLALNAEADDGRLDGLARRLGSRGAADLARAVLDLYAELGVPGVLRSRIGDFDAVRALAAEMVTPGRADTNMRRVDAATIGQVLDSTAGWLGGVR